jgi:pyrimidine oxygenase
VRPIIRVIREGRAQNLAQNLPDFFSISIAVATAGITAETADQMASQSKELQFGVFLPIANGGWIISENAPRIDGSFELNKRTALLAEAVGMDFLLSMMKWRGFGGEVDHWGTSVESIVLMAALSQVTSRVKVWCTVHTLLHNPAVVAKMLSTLDHASNGRAGINVVSGAFRDEFEQMGMWRKDLDHDSRYDLAHEWIDVIKRLWSEPRVDFDGKFFRLSDCVSEPKPISKPRPTIVCAGMSEVGLRMTAQHADAAFVNGKDDAELAAVSRRAKEIASEYGKSIKTLTYFTIVPGETDEEAEARVSHYKDGINLETLKGMAESFVHKPRTDGQANTMVLRAQQGFMTPFMAGSAKSLRQKIGETVRAGDLDGIMLIFPDFESDLKFFGERVLPGVRQDFA